MKLYRAATVLYIAESGRVRTPISEQTILKVLRNLQSQFPTHHLEDFTTDELTWFCLSRHDGRDGQPAPKTIEQRKAYVRTTFEWFRWKKLIQLDPAVDLKFTVKPGKGHVRVGTWLTEPDVREIFRAFDLSNPVHRRNRIIFLFAVSTGLRLFELAQLTWQMFTSDLRTVRITGKGSKPVDIAIPPQLREALLEWKREAWMGATAVFPAVKEAFDFGALKRRQTLNWDQPVREDGLRYVIRAAGDTIGVKLNPHDLRRTFAGIMKDKGVQLDDIQAAMRHEHLATTEGYLKKDPSRAAKVADELRFSL